MIRNLGIIIVAVLMPLIIVVGFGYRELQTEMINRMMDMNEELLQSNVVVVENMVRSIASMQEDFVGQSATASVLAAPDMDGQFQEDVQLLFREAEAFTDSMPYINAMWLYSDVSGQLIDCMEQTWQTASSYPEKGKWYYIHQVFPMGRQYALVDDTNDILICAPVFSAAGEKIGIIVFDIQMQWITDLIEDKNLQKKGTFMLVDVNGRELYCNQAGVISLGGSTPSEYSQAVRQLRPGETKRMEERDRLIMSMTVSQMWSWRYVFLTEMNQYQQENAVLRNFLLVAGLAGALLSLFTAYFITMVTYRPVKRIVDVIETPQQYMRNVDVKEANELLYITSNILRTVSSKAQADNELQERMRALRDSQMQALQYQIDPHFLYNTLETVKWVALEEIGWGSKVSKLLSKVAMLYRIGLDGSNMLVSLRDELEFLKLYVDVFNLRFGDSIYFDWEIEESLYNATVIKLCIQPLIENAVSHGLQPQGYEGAIKITAHRKEGVLYIAVDNDGDSIPQMTLDEINRKLEARSDFGGQKVGLRNVNERIKLIFGNEYGVSLQRVEQNGKVLTRSLITIPYWCIQNERRTEE